MIHAKYFCIWSTGSEEEDFENKIPFLASLWRRSHLWPWGLHLNKLKSPCPKNAPCQFKKHPGQCVVHEKKSFYIQNNVPSGWGHLWPKTLYLCKVESHCSKVASYQISMHSGQWFVNIFQIPKISPIVASFWAPKWANPSICAKFNPHSLKMLPIKFG